MSCSGRSAASVALRSLAGSLAAAAVAALALSACSVEERARTARPDPRPDKHRTPTADASADTDPSRSPSSHGSASLRPRGPVSTGWTVSRVVDGDTVEVTRGARTLDIRLIGIDTPETVHPTEPIECYGPEASAYAERRLEGEPVLLELDRSQGRRDYYGRTLAYVWLAAGPPRLFNLDAVRRGYALEYTYDDPYQWQQQVQRAARVARDHRLGVWRCPRPGS